MNEEYLFGDKTGTVCLPFRLQAIAQMVPPCDVIFDIGTDHALVPIWLIQNNRCQKAVAADVRPGPLDRAQKNINRYQAQARVQTILTDGLTGLSPGQDDVVILAGLGGHEIMRIIGKTPAPCSTLVIQAMKSLPELRSFLYQKGYRIQEERLVFEKRHFYPILHVQWDGIPETLDGLKAWVGPVLLEKKPPLLAEYLSHLRRQMLRQVRGNPALADIIDEVGTTLEALMEEKQDESIEKG